jgi:hypothetical protein
LSVLHSGGKGKGNTKKKEFIGNQKNGAFLLIFHGIKLLRTCFVFHGKKDFCVVGGLAGG